MTPEAKVKAKIKAALKARGAWFCSPIGTGWGTQGVPDILACYRGQFLGIEVKAPGCINRLTELQKDQLFAIGIAGGYSLVADDPAIVEKALNTIDTELHHG